MTQPIGVILFDADGVLIQPKHRFSVQYSQEFGVPIEQLVEFFEGPFQPALTGDADLKQLLAAVLDDWRWTGTVDELLDYWFQAESELNAQLFELVENVRAAGIRCAVATNQEHHRGNYMKRELGFATRFDAVFVSADLGVKKPDPAFFRACLERLAITGPATVLLVDDDRTNCQAASKLGLQSFFVESQPELLVHLGHLISVAPTGKGQHV